MQLLMLLFSNTPHIQSDCVLVRQQRTERALWRFLHETQKGGACFCYCSDSQDLTIPILPLT